MMGILGLILMAVGGIISAVFGILLSLVTG